MSAQDLLDFIAQHESRGDWNAVWGGIKTADRPTRPLVTMTIVEVLAWQDRIDAKYRSEAAGRYQILEDTLRGLWREAGLKPTSLFDRDGQNALGLALLNRRGLKRYLAGEITTEKFANALALEWASLPMVSGPKKGRSAYAGDGLNAALVDVRPFLAAVEGVLAAKPAPSAPPTIPTPQAAASWWWTALARIFDQITRKWRT